MIWWGRYVGAPFQDGGRGPDAFDCWGLVRAIYQDELGIHLPTYGEISARDLIRVARAIGNVANGSMWTAVSVPRAFDVALMRLPRASRVGHVGVVVSPGRILHVEKASHAVLVDVNHFSIKNRLVGYRRHT